MIGWAACVRWIAPSKSAAVIAINVNDVTFLVFILFLFVVWFCPRSSRASTDTGDLGTEGCGNFSANELQVRSVRARRGLLLLLKFCKLPLPLGHLAGPIRGFVELNGTQKGFHENFLFSCGDLVLALLHAFVTRNGRLLKHG